MRIDRIKLVTELKRRDMTQTRLATLSGVSRATINNIISGKSCSEAVAKKLADVFEIDIAKLI